MFIVFLPCFELMDDGLCSQVNATSKEDVFITFPMETRNCHHPDDFLTVINCFVEHYWPSTIQREKSLDIPLVDEDVCFMTKSPKSNTQYTLHVSNKSKQVYHSKIRRSAEYVGTET